MKVYTFIFLLASHTAIAQSIGIGTSTPHPSARLQISSTSQGLLIPTQTAAQRNAINNPATGLLVFQMDGERGFYYYNGTGWLNLTTGHPAGNQGNSSSHYSGYTITLAGNGKHKYEEGNGENASFNFPSGVAVDALGNVFVADQENNVIRRIDLSGWVSTWAGTGEEGAGDGPRSAATFLNPTDLAFDGAWNLYVVDRGNNRIRKIDLNGDVTTLAGSTEGFNDAQGTAAQFDTPQGLTLDANGNVYVADQGNQRIRKILPNGMVSTLAGSSAIGDADGAGNLASFRGPTDVAVDALGNVFVADAGNNKIRKITQGGEVSTLAGIRDAGNQDGIGAGASFDHPQGVAVDAFGNIYVADRNNHKIRKITSGNVVSTLSGTGSAGFVDGPQGIAGFTQPTHLTIDAYGDVYVADYGGARIKKILAR